MSDLPPADDPLFGNPASELIRGALEGVPGTTPAAPWEPPTPEHLAALLPQYEIERMLGRGGMGAVYMGRQRSLDRPVAIKILSGHLAGKDTSFVERFKNEARAMAKLSHPGIVAVYDFGEAAGGLLYIVMEFVEGTDVGAMIARQGRLHSEHAMAITAHVCDALAYAHERGIIHRDIKPANIMLRNDGVVKVADFGLAKVSTSSGETLGLTQSGMAMGTPHFVAPEALTLGLTIDHRADIYAVGVMLYQMLTGKLPQGLFELPSLQIPGLDPRYDGIIGKALRGDREVRYPSVQEMRRDLDAILTQPVVKVEAAAEKAPAALTTRARPQRASGPSQRPPASLPRPAPPPKSSSSGLVAAVVLVVAGAAAFFFLEMDRPAPTDSSALTQPGAENGMSPLAQSPEATPSSADPVQATKDKPFVNTLGMKFVPVPGTDILMCIHETRRQDYTAYLSATPSVKSTMTGLQHDGIDVGSTDLHPVCNLTWDQAQAFCAWLSKKDGREYRLPTDREWSWAVGIGDKEDPGTPPSALVARLHGEYPWGTSWPPPPKSGNFSDASAAELLNTKAIPEYHDGFGGLAPVMSFPPNTLGIHDLAGNVWEWCSDWYDASTQTHVLRGGCYRDGGVDNGNYLRSASRISRPLQSRSAADGFRVVMDSGSRYSKSTPPRPTTVGTTKAELVSATKDKPFVNTLGMEFVPVPGTEVLFCIHETRRADYAAYAAGNAAVDASWKNPDFRGIPVSSGDDHPVCNVSWDDAKSFCTWLGKKEGLSYRLPTDREWSMAVGIAANEPAGKTPVELHLMHLGSGVYPWGTEWPPPKGAGNFSDVTAKQMFPLETLESFIEGYSDGWAGTAPVMSFKPNTLGLFDLAGNVYELCEDWTDEKRLHRVVRGHSWNGGTTSALLSSNRGSHAPTARIIRHGFRVVLNRAAKLAADGGAAAASTASSSAPPTEPMTWTDMRDAFNAVREARPALPTGPTTWTDTKGRSLTATFKAIAGGNVLLDIAGKITPVALNTLSAESQKLARDLDAAQKLADAIDPAKATKDKPFVNTLGMKFVPVPGTQVLFCIHETRKADYAAFFAATPGVPAFWQNPIYEGAPVSFADDHPVCNIRWQDCQDFCQWLSRKEGRTYRLPTDSEWSFAVGIGDREDASLSPHLLSDRLTGEFPWGKEWPPPVGAGNLGDSTMAAKFPKKRSIPGYTDGFATTAPVMSFSPNRFGLYDLSGNIWEFCQDWYDETRTKYVIRGLNFDDSGESSVRFLSSHRGLCPVGNRHSNFGFRVVLERPAETDPANASGASAPAASDGGDSREDPAMAELLAFERTLRSHTWLIPDRNWELRFENDHRAPIDERVYTTRWHWWITGPRSLHVHFAAAPPPYDPSIGAEYIFDKDMKSFTNGTGKPIGVRRSALAAPEEADLGRSFAPEYAKKLGGNLRPQFPSR